MRSIHDVIKYVCWSCLTVEFHSKNHQFTCLTSVIIVLWCNMACWQNNWEATDLSWHLKCQSPDSSSVTMQVILIITIIVNHGHHHRHLWQSLKFNFFVFSFLCPLPLNNLWRILLFTDSGTRLNAQIFQNLEPLTSAKSMSIGRSLKGNAHTIIISQFLLQNKLLKEQKPKSDK